MRGPSHDRGRRASARELKWRAQISAQRRKSGVASAVLSNRSAARTAQDMAAHHRAGAGYPDARRCPGSFRQGEEPRWAAPRGGLGARSIACSDMLRSQSCRCTCEISLRSPQRQPDTPNSVSPVPVPERNDLRRLDQPKLHGQVSTFWHEYVARKTSPAIPSVTGQKAWRPQTAGS